MADSSGSPPSPKAVFGNARLFARTEVYRFRCELTQSQAANRLLDDMSWWAKTLKPAREGMTTGVAGREQREKAVTVTA
jgi:hypothetical protein